MKTILYLDQNYVSGITGARLGLTTSASLHQALTGLYSALVHSVEHNLLVCPVSEFHHSESELDDRLASEIFGTLDSLYCGVELRSFSQILLSQAQAALPDFLGIPAPSGDKWREAFNQNPDQKCRRPEEPLSVRWSGFFKDLSRQTKKYHERQRELAPVGDLETQKRVEALRFIADAFVRPYFSFLQGIDDIFTFAALDLPVGILRSFSELVGRQPTADEFIAFLGSREMLSVPFLDVYSSLRAGMIIWHQARKQKGSDLNDVLILATALPYSDLVATDSFMAQLVKSLKLDARFAVTVYGGGPEEVASLASVIADMGGS